MKSILIVAALLTTIMASESSAQTKVVDTIAMTKEGVPVITLPRGGKQEDKKVQPKVDTARVVTIKQYADVIIREERLILRVDSIAIRQAAARFMKIEGDTAAALPQFTIRGDTVFVPTRTHIGLTVVPVMYHDGQWVGVGGPR